MFVLIKWKQMDPHATSGYILEQLTHVHNVMVNQLMNIQN
jgi:hypothetical protein